jgi:hypothetical protein
MSTRHFVREQQDQILLDSIRQQRQVVITQNTPSGWRTYKAAFLCGSPESSDLSLRIEDCPDELSAKPPAAGSRIGCTFRLGHKKCMFSAETRLMRFHGDCADMTVGWPEQIQQLQRRAYERAAPPHGTVIAVRFWREGAEAAGEARIVRHGQLEDISCGGVRIKVPDPSVAVMGASYKCVFTPRPGKPALVLDTILRHREAVDRGRASLGFQFVGLETTPERLRTLDRLARLVRHFQRGHGKPAHAVVES